MGTELNVMWVIAILLAVIAACEIIRTGQNERQLFMLRRDTKSRDNAYSEFVKSLKESDREFVKQLLKEFEEQEGAEDGN